MHTIFNSKSINASEKRFASKFSSVEYIYNEICNDLLYNVNSINNINPKNILIIFPRNFYLVKNIASIYPNAKIYTMDANNTWFKFYGNDATKYIINQDIYEGKINSDLVRDVKFDMILSPIGMHKINNIEMFLVLLKNLLTPSGIIMFNVFGVGNISKIIEIFYNKEIEFHNRYTQRFLPVIDAQSLAMLMQSSGYKNIVTSKSDINIITHNNILNILRYSCESNCLIKKNYHPDRFIYHLFRKNILDIKNMNISLSCVFASH
jgi:hypothetical protein